MVTTRRKTSKAAATGAKKTHSRHARAVKHAVNAMANVIANKPKAAAAGAKKTHSRAIAHAVNAVANVIATAPTAAGKAKKVRKVTRSNDPTYKPRPALRRIVTKDNHRRKVAGDVYGRLMRELRPWLATIVRHAEAIAEGKLSNKDLKDGKRKIVKSTDIIMAYKVNTGSSVYANSLNKKDATYAKLKQCSRSKSDSCLEIPHAVFVKMVRASASKHQKFSVGSMKLLQSLAEKYIKKLSNSGGIAAMHAGKHKHTIKTKDINAALAIHHALKHHF